MGDMNAKFHTMSWLSRCECLFSWSRCNTVCTATLVALTLTLLDSHCACNDTLVVGSSCVFDVGHVGVCAGIVSGPLSDHNSDSRLRPDIDGLPKA